MRFINNFLLLVTNLLGSTQVFLSHSKLPVSLEWIPTIITINGFNSLQ